jgi:hypothetical protein
MNRNLENVNLKDLSPWQLGFSVGYNCGSSENANPFEDGSSLYVAWKDGYNAGAAQYGDDENGDDV